MDADYFHLTLQNTVATICNTLALTSNNNVSRPRAFFIIIVCGEGPRSRSYGRTAALRLIVQPVVKMKRRKIRFFFSFFQVMKHRRNATDRGKQKYSGKNLSQCLFVHHKSHMH
jgi:hypothetical protein